VVEVSASIALVAAGGGAGGAAFGRAAGYVGGALLGLLLAARVFGRGGLALHASDRGRRAAIGRYAGALLVVNAAWALFTQIDILLIGAILGPAAVGVYSAPLRITTLLHYPGLALSNSVSPRVAGDSPDVATFVRALRLLVVLQAAMTVPIVVWAGPLVELLFDEGYGESADVLRAMAGYVFLFGIAPLISVSVNYLGEAKRRIPIALATVAVNVAIDLALLESMGPAAAGLATSVAFLIYVVGHLRIVQRLLGVPMRPLLATLAKAAAGAAAFTGVLLAVGTSDLAWWQWIAGLAGGGAAYLAVLAALGEHSLRDLTRLLRR
jgi:O-antigen/teichoic acid export membrane protein